MQDAISEKLVAVIDATRDSENLPYFGNVVDYDIGNEKFDEWPICMVLPSDQPADVGDNKVNDRREGFTAFIMLPIGEPTLEERQDRYKQMRVLTDVVRNAIDATIDLDGLRANDNRDRVMGVVPATAGWDTIETSAGATLMVRVEITVRYSHRVN